MTLTRTLATPHTGSDPIISFLCFDLTTIVLAVEQNIWDTLQQAVGYGKGCDHIAGVIGYILASLFKTHRPVPR